jgi:hypothetical protein
MKNVTSFRDRLISEYVAMFSFRGTDPVHAGVCAAVRASLVVTAT